MRPSRIISGGQTGADQGALVAAKQLGIDTGGWMPRGFLTEAGPCPALADVYGLKEMPSADYPKRTRQNVKDSDGTVWIGDREDSRGFLCTEKWCDHYERPFLKRPVGAMVFRDWLLRWNIRVLNVAGPRASSDDLAHTRAAQFLINALTE